MKKYYYTLNRTYRCRVKYISLHDHFELQVQKNHWFWGYENKGRWVTVDEHRPKPEENLRLGNPLTDSYQFGNISESYAKGTLDLPKRVSDFIKEVKGAEVERLLRVKEVKQLLS